MKIFVGLGIAGLLILVGLVIVDLTSSTPTPPPGRCVLKTYFVLPNRCLSSCASGVDCPPVKTTSYAIFWTQPTSCPDGIICGARMEREPKTVASWRPPDSANIKTVEGRLRGIRDSEVTLAFH